MRWGFTLIELILVMGIFALLATLSSVTFFSTVGNSHLVNSANLLLADLRSQQARAMAGEGSMGLTAFSDRYILFVGETYNPADPGNLSVALPSGVTLAATLPGGQAVFVRGLGELAGYTVGQDSYTLTAGLNQRVIRLNQYGVAAGAP